MAIDGKPVPLQEQWKALAEMIADETDPTKILTLTKRLIELDQVYTQKRQSAICNSVTNERLLKQAH
jgi:hypothetical protein